MKDELTNAEYAILGLLMERPCHGYDLDRLIEQRGMREWTELAFSSIYYILGRLEKRGLAESRPDPEKKTRKIYRPTAKARERFTRTTIRALSEPHPLYPSVLLGLANWPSLDHATAIEALERRGRALESIAAGVESKRKAAMGLPPHVSVLFDYSQTLLRAEIDWVKRASATLGDDHGKD
ncbi:PadR family transcriptional regulator [Hoeflea poritis]|uniref:PadR family transcriptional regulator n=1 Tax=Hoeflea poritis TaxID=2993659 RepID=A0ABT4VVS9_9HYPH|nr:PadR family transcriptional regulator [Hoeflea poritis]MDA4848806.1 PadR family transcriptional regulator [Hoeflea poritis]